MQNQFRSAPLDLSQWNLAEQRDWILVQLPPARGIQIAKQADAIVVPAPPNVAGQRPEPFLRRSNESVQRASLAHHRRHLVGRLHQHANFILPEDPRVLGLHNQNSLQDPAVDQRYAQERSVFFFPRFFEVLESRMILHVVHGHRQHLFRHQPGKPLAERHAQFADRSRVQPKCRRQHQVRSIRLKQIR